MYNKSALALLALSALLVAPASADGLYGAAYDPMTPPMKDSLRERASLAKSLNLTPDQVDGLTARFGRRIDPTDFMLGVYHQCTLWEDQRELTVCFVDDDTAGRQVFPDGTTYRQAFVDASREWVANNSPRLVFGSAPTYQQCAGDKKEDIRVSFSDVSERGKEPHWACVGRNSTLWGSECSNSLASLNISPAIAKNDKQEFRRAVIHEMGHALGLMHEHQHPNMRCWETEIDRPVVCARYLHHFGLDCETVEKLFRSLDNTNHHLGVWPYDPKSIMHYEIPPDYFREGVTPTCAAPKNREPSPDDRTLVRWLYPPSGAPRESCSDRVSALSWSLGLTREQKGIFGGELARRLAAGTGKKDLTIKLDGGPGALLPVPPDRPFAKVKPEAQPTAPVNGGGATDCTPAALKGKASCSLSADGAVLNITIH